MQWRVRRIGSGHYVTVLARIDLTVNVDTIPYA